MSLWDSDNCRNNSVCEKKSQFQQTNSKIDLASKLHIIHALDSGQSRAALAREYRVRPPTIANIYKQKDSLLRKYTQGIHFLKVIRRNKLEQILLDWLKLENQSGNDVTEENLRDKAQEIDNTLGEEHTCLDDWLIDFKKRHKINILHPDIEWNQLISGLKVEDFYVGGIFPLLYSLDLDTFVNGYEPNDFLSIFFIVHSSGADKKKLAIVGRETLNSNCTRSSPACYYSNYKSQVNYDIMHDCLEQWNDELSSTGRNVFLALNIPDKFSKKINFSNVSLMNPCNIDYFNKLTEKLIRCFKCQYRQLQLTKKKINVHSNSCPFTMKDYISMISLAWHSVSNRYIQRIIKPPNQQILYFKTENDTYFQWNEINNILVDSENTEINLSLLEKYLSCDKKLSCLAVDDINTKGQEVNENLSPIEDTVLVSGIDAYQAMKRLVSYLHGESAQEPILTSAKYLENCVEYGALYEINHSDRSSNEEEYSTN